MIKMKRMLTILLVMGMLFSMASCGSASSAASQPVEEAAKETMVSQTVDTSHTEAEIVSQNQADVKVSGSDTLVIYFSRTGEQYNVGVIEKGNTAIVAEMIAETTGADLYEVIPADDHYPTTYKELTDVGIQEQRERARPAIGGELPDISGYDTVFVGAPVWWGDWPMIMYTLFESVDLNGKTLIPFSTHGGSGLSGFDRSLGAVFPNSEVLKGLAITGTDAQNKQDDVKTRVQKWITELGV